MEYSGDARDSDFEFANRHFEAHMPLLRRLDPTPV
jgi:hypothetical protein